MQSFCITSVKCCFAKCSLLSGQTKSATFVSSISLTLTNFSTPKIFYLEYKQTLSQYNTGWRRYRTHFYIKKISINSLGLVIHNDPSLMSYVQWKLKISCYEVNTLYFWYKGTYMLKQISCFRQTLYFG